jgi:ABC-2 type transport system permease protein
MVPTMMRVGFANVLVYRAEVLIWILTTTMPLIMFAMWSTLAEEAPIGRFDEAMFASYFLAMLVVRQLSGAWVVWELNDKIRTGTLSVLLLRPVHPLLYFAIENLAAIPMRLVVLIPVVAAAIAFIPGIRFSSDPLHIALAFWAVALSWLLTFLIQAMIGLLALYTQQSLAFQEAWFGMWALFSGYLIPLELAPSIGQFARWLPFRSVGALSVEIALGHLEGTELTESILVQIAWVVIVLVMLRVLWSRAMRRFEAYGS